MDKIGINGISVYGYHGALPEEQRLGQPFRVSLELELDTRPAAAADALEKTVNYAAVVQAVEAIVQGERVCLIETLAERIASRVLAEFPLVQAVTVKVEKPFAPVAARFEGICVTIRRTR